jgi:poly-beta-1,6-N-acetyl-D-glucosamine synthase
MEIFIDEFISFISSLGFERFLRLFWFFVFFELSRYVFIDFIILLFYRLNVYFRRFKRKDCVNELRFENPLVSLVIPGKNEGKNLYKLVTSLKQQTYKNIEIIVVDDGSDDETSIIGRNLEKAGLIDFFLRNEIRGGKASAANLALRFSKGKFIVHLDADCSFDYNAIERILVPFYEDSQVGAVGGNVFVRNYKENLVSTFQALEYYDTISIGRIVSSHLGIYRVISGAFGAFRSEVMSELKGWDIGPGLDGDITVKIKKIGYKVKFAADAVCLTSVPNSFKKLTKQRLRWDKSLVRFRMRKHRDVFLPTQLFNWPSFFSFSENIFYGFILNVQWIVYFIDVVINNGSQLTFILLTNVCLYTSVNYVKFMVYSLFRTRKIAPIYYFLPYLPGMVFYFGYYLRVVRTIAHFREIFFKSSYKDPWNPAKTSKFAKKLGL